MKKLTLTLASLALFIFSGAAMAAGTQVTVDKGVISGVVNNVGGTALSSPDMNLKDVPSNSITKYKLTVNTDSKTYVQISDAKSNGCLLTLSSISNDGPGSNSGFATATIQPLNQQYGTICEIDQNATIRADAGANPPNN